MLAIRNRQWHISFVFSIAMPEDIAWIEGFAKAVRDIDSEGFMGSLIDAIEPVAPLESNLILLFRRTAPPLVLHEAVNTREHDLFYGKYLKGGYMLSPYYRIWRDRQKTGFLRMKDIVPEDFEGTDVYKDYYLHTGLADEAAYLADMDYKSAIFLWIGICSRDYTDKEISVYQRLEPIVSACVQRHWMRMKGLFSDSPTPDRRFHQRLEGALASFGTSVLSDREVEIVQLLLKGHSTKSAAEKLKIAPGTVKNHRNNIYCKLDITSQAELFSLFIQSISQSDLNSTGDPLETYLSRPATVKEQ